MRQITTFEEAKKLVSNNIEIKETSFRYLLSVDYDDGWHCVYDHEDSRYTDEYGFYYAPTIGELIEWINNKIPPNMELTINQVNEDNVWEVYIEQDCSTLALFEDKELIDALVELAINI